MDNNMDTLKFDIKSIHSNIKTDNTLVKLGNENLLCRYVCKTETAHAGTTSSQCFFYI